MTFTLDPRLEADTIPVTEWSLSTVRLMNDSQYPWLILVPQLPGLRDLIDVPADRRAELSTEIDRASRALKALFEPDKLNVASLGNQVAQLHVHVIARSPGDAAWPAPVWGHVSPVPYTPDARKQTVERLLLAL